MQVKVPMRAVMSTNILQLLSVTFLIRTKPDPLWTTADSESEVDFCPALTFLLFFSPEIHWKVSTMQQHKREHDTVISCGEEAVSQLPATFKPGKSLRI